MTTITVSATFTKNTGQPAIGLILNEINFYLTRQNKLTGAIETIWDGAQNPTIEVTNIGAYIRLYENADLDTYNYFAAAQYTGATELDANWITGALSEDNAGVWSYAYRTLTQSAAQVVATVAGSNISVKRGDKWIIPLTGLGNLSDREKLWFTVKQTYDDVDSASILMVEETEGLIYVRGNEATMAAYGSLTVIDEEIGSVIIEVEKQETVDMIVSSSLVYDVQKLTIDGAIQTRPEGNFEITADVTRAIN